MPFMQTATLNVSAPQGFKPQEAPQPVTLESAFGRYSLFVSVAESGFRVERTFIISTPYAQQDVVWELFKRYYGQDGDVLVWKAPTSVMNPTLAQSVIDRARALPTARAAVNRKRARASLPRLH